MEVKARKVGAKIDKHRTPLNPEPKVPEVPKDTLEIDSPLRRAAQLLPRPSRFPRDSINTHSLLNAPDLETEIQRQRDYLGSERTSRRKGSALAFLGSAALAATGVVTLAAFPLPALAGIGSALAMGGLGAVKAFSARRLKKSIGRLDSLPEKAKELDSRTNEDILELAATHVGFRIDGQTLKKSRRSEKSQAQKVLAAIATEKEVEIYDLYHPVVVGRAKLENTDDLKFLDYVLGAAPESLQDPDLGKSIGARNMTLARSLSCYAEARGSFASSQSVKFQHFFETGENLGLKDERTAKDLIRGQKEYGRQNRAYSYGRRRSLGEEYSDLVRSSRTLVPLQTKKGQAFWVNAETLGSPEKLAQKSSKIDLLFDTYLYPSERNWGDGIYQQRKSTSRVLHYIASNENKDLSAETLAPMVVKMMNTEFSSGHPVKARYPVTRSDVLGERVEENFNLLLRSHKSPQKLEEAVEAYAKLADRLPRHLCDLGLRASLLELGESTISERAEIFLNQAVQRGFTNSPTEAEWKLQQEAHVGTYVDELVKRFSDSPKRDSFRLKQKLAMARNSYS